MNEISTNPDSASPEHRRKPRVAWRAILGVALVIGMATGYWAMGRQKAVKQLEAIEQLERAGTRVYLEYQWNGVEPVEDGRPPEAAWVRRLLGDAMFDRAVAVDLRSAHDLPTVTESLKWLPYLQYVDARGTRFSDVDLAPFQHLPSVRHLDLGGTLIGDQGVMVALRDFHWLEFLSLANTDISDAGAASLGQLKRLRLLDLSGTNLTSSGVQSVRKELPRCRVVFVDPEAD